jgi:uncharacterized protein YihD (DUF1040 family)
MRNPKRIPGVLKVLQEAWEQNPDIRLGQLVCIAAKKEDPFNIEDDKMLDRLKAIIGHTDE